MKLDIHINAAFTSSVRNQCYLFVKGKYIVVNYAPGEKKKDVISGPVSIGDGFPMFDSTIFENGIDAAFDTGNNGAFIFSGTEVAKTDYSPLSSDATIQIGPIPISAMFPSLKGTVFGTGITAAMRSEDERQIFFFKGEDCCLIDITTRRLINNTKIGTSFPSFVGTVFELGLDAAFNSHTASGTEVFIFKGEYYAHYNIRNGQFIDGFVKRIRADWPALQRILPKP